MIIWCFFIVLKCWRYFTKLGRLEHHRNPQQLKIFGIMSRGIQIGLLMDVDGNKMLKNPAIYDSLCMDHTIWKVMFSLFPTIVYVDATMDTNSEGCPLLSLVGNDTCSKLLQFLESFCQINNYGYFNGYSVFCYQWCAIMICWVNSGNYHWW